MAGLTQIHHPPDAADNKRETALVMNTAPEPEPQASELPVIGLNARQVILNHVETVNIYTQLPAAPEEMAP